MALNETAVPGITRVYGEKIIVVPAGQTINIELNGVDDSDMTWTNTSSGEVSVYVEMGGNY